MRTERTPGQPQDVVVYHVPRHTWDDVLVVSQACSPWQPQLDGQCIHVVHALTRPRATGLVDHVTRKCDHVRLLQRNHRPQKGGGVRMGTRI